MVGGLILAALVGAAGVAIIASAAPGEPAIKIDQPAVSMSIDSTRADSNSPGHGLSSMTPFELPSPVDNAATAPADQRLSSQVDQPSAGIGGSGWGPAVVSPLGPDDTGFGWPSGAFGVAPPPAVP